MEVAWGKSPKVLKFTASNSRDKNENRKNTEAGIIRLTLIIGGPDYVSMTLRLILIFLVRVRSDISPL